MKKRFALFVLLITLGQKDISENGTHDLVALDDFLYSVALKK